MQLKFIALSQIPALLLTAGAKVFGVLHGDSLFFFAVAEAAAAAIYGGLLTLFFLSRSPWRSWRWQLRQNILRQALRDGFPLLLTSLATTVLIQCDVVMLKMLASEEEVGYFAVTVRWIFFWYFVPMVLGTAWFPRIVQAKAVSPQAYFLELQQFFCLHFYAGLLCCGGALAMSWCIPFFYGPAYAPAAQIMRIYAFALPFLFWGVARVRQLTAENRNYELFCCTAVGAICNILLNFILIPLGCGYCAAGTVVAFFIAFVGMSWLFFQPQTNRALFRYSLGYPFRYRKISKGESSSCL